MPTSRAAMMEVWARMVPLKPTGMGMPWNGSPAHC